MERNFLIKWNRHNLLASFALCMTVALSSSASAQLQVDMKQGKIEPLPIAVVDFFGTGNDADRLGRDVAGIIGADLERSGLFRLIDPKAFIQERESLRLRPQFSAWRQINAQALVVGTAEVRQSGQLRVEFRLWDVFGGTQLVGLRSDTLPSNGRDRMLVAPLAT